MLEMIIVIFVFLTGIVGVYTIISNSYAATVFASNRLTALYLSQEVIELVKNIRDNNLIAGGTTEVQRKALRVQHKLDDIGVMEVV